MPRRLIDRWRQSVQEDGSTFVEGMANEVGEKLDDISITTPNYYRELLKAAVAEKKKAGILGFEVAYGNFQLQVTIGGDCAETQFTKLVLVPNTKNLVLVSYSTSLNVNSKGNPYKDNDNITLYTVETQLARSPKPGEEGAIVSIPVTFMAHYNDDKFDGKFSAMPIAGVNVGFEVRDREKTVWGIDTVLNGSRVVKRNGSSLFTASRHLDIAEAQQHIKLPLERFLAQVEPLPLPQHQYAGKG